VKTGVGETGEVSDAQTLAEFAVNSSGDTKAKTVRLADVLIAKSEIKMEGLNHPGIPS